MPHLAVAHVGIGGQAHSGAVRLQVQQQQHPCAQPAEPQGFAGLPWPSQASPCQGQGGSQLLNQRYIAHPKMEKGKEVLRSGLPLDPSPSPCSPRPALSRRQCLGAVWRRLSISGVLAMWMALYSSLYLLSPHYRDVIERMGSLHPEHSEQPKFRALAGSALWVGQ